MSSIDDFEVFKVASATYKALESRRKFIWKLVWKFGSLLKLIQSKCIPALLYGLEACPLNKADLNSSDFVVNRFL